MTAMMERTTVSALPGNPFPMGATPRDGGTNFAVASSIAEAITLCLFDKKGNETQIALPDYDAGVWHGFVPGVGPGQAYGYRVSGPYDRDQGLRCNPAKLLLDPYARATDGWVCFGPEVFDYDIDNHEAPSSLATLSPSEVDRSAITTFAPCDSNFSVVALPKPDAPPVTTAAIPSIFIARPTPSCSSQPFDNRRVGEAARLTHRL